MVWVGKSTIQYWGDGGVGVVGMGCGEGLGMDKGAVVRLISCNAPLKASRLLWENTLGGSLFHWAIVRGGGGGGDCIYNSCGRWIFVCICVGGWILFGCVRV